MDFSLATIDAVIVIGYLIFVILLGFYFSQKHEDAEDYFLAGRSLTWPLIGFHSLPLICQVIAWLDWQGLDIRMDIQYTAMNGWRSSY